MHENFANVVKPKSEEAELLAQIDPLRLPQHIAVCYRPGELVCYLDGRRVYHDASMRGGSKARMRFSMVFSSPRTPSAL